MVEICIISGNAPVAQMDRAIASGAIGREFESLRAHQILAFTWNAESTREKLRQDRSLIRQSPIRTIPHSSHNAREVNEVEKEYICEVALPVVVRCSSL